MISDNNPETVNSQTYKNAEITAEYDKETGEWMLILTVPGETIELRYAPSEPGKQVPPGKQIELVVKELADQ